MKLRSSRVEFLAAEILKYLESEKFLEVIDSNSAYKTIMNVIVDDLLVEERLDEEVRQILEQYSDKMDQDRIQYYEMFKMVKTKLAKERNLIL